MKARWAWAWTALLALAGCGGKSAASYQAGQSVIVYDVRETRVELLPIGDLHEIGVPVGSPALFLEDVVFPPAAAGKFPPSGRIRLLEGPAKDKVCLIPLANLRPAPAR